MIVVRAPLRISFFGGGTDFPEFYEHFGAGAVLSSAISLSTYVVVKPRWDKRILLHYTKRELVDSVWEIEHDLIRESMRLMGPSGGIEIATFADVPSEGTGLGSSSSITVALIAALAAYSHRTEALASARDVAEMAYQVEARQLGNPVGKQDHYAAALGGINLIQFGRDGVDYRAGEIVAPRTRVELNARLMLFYTGRTRRAAAILGAQRANIPNRVSTLRMMAEQAKLGADLLRANRIDEFGRMLDEAWTFKRSLADAVSDPEIDDLYARARAAGALGGKLCGAGGGGFLLLYVPIGQQNAVRDALLLQQVHFDLGAPGTRVIFRETWP